MVKNPDRHPLAGWRILVTRPREQASVLGEALQNAGAEAVIFPTITLGPPPTWRPFDAAVARLPSYDWMVFTSPSAVRFAVDRAPDLPAQLGLAGAPRVAAVGSETAKALAQHAVSAIVPSDQRQEGLAQALSGLAPGHRVLFPQALGGRETLRQALESQGVSVDVVPVSETVPIPFSEGTRPPVFDVATFASPSALRAFVDAFGAAVLAETVVAVIGPTTEAAARAAGVAVHVVAPTPSVPALVSALCAHLRPR